MKPKYESLEVEIPQDFLNLHQECVTEILTSFRGSSKTDLEGVFLNIYKIHIEFVDSVIELLRPSHLNHISSSMIMRSMFENVAMFKHVSESDDSVAKKYLNKVNIFEGMSRQKAVSILEKGQFGNLARFDDSNTMDRVAKLTPSAKLTYDMLSAYTHVSPFITRQMNAKAGDIVKAKELNLQAVSVAYLALLYDAYSNGIKFNKQEQLIQRFLTYVDQKGSGVYG